MTRMIAVMALLIASATASGEDVPVKFAGEWKTTAGPVTFQQKGDEVTGKIVFFNLPVKGKVEDKGKKLAVSYVENGVKVNATLEFDASGNAFTGTSKASNGNSWAWNGWRADPSAASAKPADFSGLWLTDLGLMELTKDGSKVKGRYALRGTSSLEGEAKGRHLDFKLKTLAVHRPRLLRPRREGHQPRRRRRDRRPGRLVRLEGPQGFRIRQARPAGRRQDRRRLDREPADLLRPRPRRLQGGRLEEMARRPGPPRLEHER